MPLWVVYILYVLGAMGILAFVPIAILAGLGFIWEKIQGRRNPQTKERRTLTFWDIRRKIRSRIIFNKLYKRK